ncbi:unnamed protein product [Protopolystoma xenopodis]|uniref:Uncharacterized protein n=1 Tax=Protopolystoma xenopodis TaxID=117903 RepID=A0A448WC00_9PLAT|nr:unnamed protein product [Protopolystoma xenopodis]
MFLSHRAVTRFCVHVVVPIWERPVYPYERGCSNTKQPARECESKNQNRPNTARTGHQIDWSNVKRFAGYGDYASKRKIGEAKEINIVANTLNGSNECRNMVSCSDDVRHMTDKAQQGLVGVAGRCAEDLFAQIYNHSSKVTSQSLWWSQLTNPLYSSL